MAADPSNAIGEIFDILTFGSPLKTKPVREAIKAAGAYLVTTGEPQAMAFGSSLVGLAKIFETRALKRKKGDKK